MSDTDCLCGTCGPCRRADRLHTRRPPVTPPAELSLRAQAVLYDWTYEDPFDKAEVKKPYARVKKKVTATPKHPKVAEGRPSRAKPVPEPIPCVECGELRGLAKVGPSVRVTGKEDRCEVCFDRARITARLARHENSVDPLHKNDRLRLIKALDRVLKDGRAFHPDAPHGTITGYGNYYCRCAPCVEAKTNRNRTRPSRTINPARTKEPAAV